MQFTFVVYRTDGLNLFVTQDTKCIDPAIYPGLSKVVA